MTHRVRRTDRIPLSDAHRNSAGVLVVPASLSRTGIQVYETADGKTVREFRPATEVFAAESLDSLRSAPVTIGHPPDGVDGESLSRLTVGLVSDRDPKRVRRDGEDFVETTLAIVDSRVQSSIESNPPGLVEISLGYDARLDFTPGRTDAGEPFDAVQRDIRINHAALLPAGQARAGKQARIRLDGHEEITDAAERSVDTPQKSEESHMSEVPAAIVKLKIDGIDYVEGSAEHIAKLHSMLDDALEVIKTEVAKTATALKDLGTEKAKSDKLDADLRVALAIDVDKLIADASEFRADAAKLLDTGYVFKGKSPEQVKRDAIGEDACKRVDAQPEGIVRDAHLEATYAMAITQAADKKTDHSVDPDAAQAAGAIADTGDENADFADDLHGRYADSHKRAIS